MASEGPTSADSSTQLIPLELREGLSRLAIHIDLAIKGSAEFDELWRSLSPRGAAETLLATPETENETAIRLEQIGKQDDVKTFHLVLEYRRGRRSPYPRVPEANASALLEFLRRSAFALRLASWQEALEADQARMAEHADEFKQVFAALDKLTSRTNAPTLTGLEFAAKPVDDLQGGFSLRWGRSTITFTRWVRGRHFNTLDEVLDAGPRLIAAVVPELAKGENPLTSGDRK